MTLRTDMQRLLLSCLLLFVSTHTVSVHSPLTVSVFTHCCVLHPYAEISLCFCCSLNSRCDFHARAAFSLEEVLFSCSADNVPSLCPPSQTLSSGVFELKIDSFTSSRSICRSSARDCQIFFRVCLKHSQDVINPEPPCTYGTAVTDIFGADSNSISESAPIRVPIHFKWPVGAKRRETSATPPDSYHIYLDLFHFLYAFMLIHRSCACARARALSHQLIHDVFNRTFHGDSRGLSL